MLLQWSARSHTLHEQQNTIANTPASGRWEALVNVGAVAARRLLLGVGVKNSSAAWRALVGGTKAAWAFLTTPAPGVGST
jgi:hypothetical protein